jgi:hypothetical protein
MSIEDIIIGLYIRVDIVMAKLPKHPQAELYPSELVTIGLLFALKGESSRRFYTWLNQNHRKWFPRLPERTRLFRLLATHADWTDFFLAQPTMLGVADTYGIELRHPWREHRADGQIGDKGLSNHRWIVGAKLGYVLNHYGLVVAWDYACANVADNAFTELISDFQDEMVILTDMAFHRAEGDPPNQKPCKRGTWGVRMVVETVLSLLTRVCRLKKVGHRKWSGLKARLAYTMALFNLLMMWDGLPADENNILHISMAQFVL